jgi:hypothetical protein
MDTLETPLQEGGTCWFHAMINLFFLSERIKTFVYYALVEYISKLKQRDLVVFQSLGYNYAACPTKQYSRFFLMKYLWNVLFNRPAIERLSFQVVRNTFREFRSMSNENLNKGMRHGGIRLDTFFTRLGIPFILHDHPTNLPKTHAGPLHPLLIHRPSYAGGMEFSITSPVRISGISYDIDCSLIKLSSKTNGYHLIFGYVYRGKRYIRDSNGPDSFECDWTNAHNILSNAKYNKFSAETYGSSWTLAYYITNIWIRSDQMPDPQVFTRDPGGISPIAISERIRILIDRRAAGSINKTMMSAQLASLEMYARVSTNAARLLTNYRAATNNSERMGILNRAARLNE